MQHFDTFGLHPLRTRAEPHIELGFERKELHHESKTWHVPHRMVE
jgi:hypothetical protein